MKTMEIARRFAELEQKKEAQDAYLLALEEDLKAEEELEAASFLFFSEADYRIPFTHFVSLYNRGYFQEEIFNLMLQAFYLPNVQDQQQRYRANCRCLESYPYLFRKDFLPFEELPVLFFPFDDRGFVPYDLRTKRFGNFVDFSKPVIDRYFFRDLEKPVLAAEVYSQYQLAYLNDTVRESQWVAKENHIYLHYEKWELFCASLCCLRWKELLKDEKFVFLMEEELSRYPIDFQAEYGIDYSRYPVKPLAVEEIHRLIWHTQLSSHNGGDFFNEVLHGHPNLLSYSSLMFDTLLEQIEDIRKDFVAGKSEFPLVAQLLQPYSNPNRAQVMIACFLSLNQLDPTQRIVPAILFQPHFGNMECNVKVNERERVLESPQYDEIAGSDLFAYFPYIKSFTPIRRPTTSYGATIRFKVRGSEDTTDDLTCVDDVLSEKLTNQSFWIDPHDRLFQDSRMVRFEDGKLNPKATFTALAEFLDIPYTNTLEYCSDNSGFNPESMPGNDVGFSPAAIYRTYDEYCDDADRAVLEYIYRDAYRAYGYDFHYYQGEPVDEAWVEQKLKEMPHLDQKISESAVNAVLEKFKRDCLKEEYSASELERVMKEARASVDQQMAGNLKTIKQHQLEVLQVLLHEVPFVNQNGQPLQMMTPLKLDPELLEQPLYH